MQPRSYWQWGPRDQDGHNRQGHNVNKPPGRTNESTRDSSPDYEINAQPRGPDWPLAPNFVRGAEYERLLGLAGHSHKPPSSDYVSALLKQQPQIKEQRSQWMNRALELSEEYGICVPDNWTTHATFSPRDLASHFIISSPEPLENDLKNAIHPIFDFGQWKNISKSVYDFIAPALRIASRYLTHPACSQFWITLILGEREWDPFHSARVDSYCERIKCSPPVTAENFKAVQDWLYSLAEKRIVTFNFNSETHTPLQVPGKYGATNFIHYTEVRRSFWTEDWRNAPDGQRHWHAPVFLHHDFLRVIQKRIDTGFNDDSHKLRFYWSASPIEPTSYAFLPHQNTNL